MLKKETRAEEENKFSYGVPNAQDLRTAEMSMGYFQGLAHAKIPNKTDMTMEAGEVSHSRKLSSMDIILTAVYYWR